MYVAEGLNKAGANQYSLPEAGGTHTAPGGGGGAGNTNVHRPDSFLEKLRDDGKEEEEEEAAGDKA